MSEKKTASTKGKMKTATKKPQKKAAPAKKQPQKKSKPYAKKTYTDAEKLEVLHVLHGLNNGNFYKTEKETGVPRNTLMAWNKDYTVIEKSAEEVHASTKTLVHTNQLRVQQHYDSLIDKLAEADHMIVDMIMEKLNEVKGAKGKKALTLSISQLVMLMKQVGERVKAIQAKDDGTGVNLTQNNIVVNVFKQAENELRRHGAM